MLFSDCRVAILKTGDLWVLSLKEVRAKDEGTYQCQISAETKLVKKVELVVVVPRVEVVPGGEKHVKKDSKVVMRCMVEQVIQRPLHVSWIRNNKVRQT